MADAKKAPRRTNTSPIACKRMALGMTQGQLAEIIGCYGKDISRWETGERNPSAKALAALAKALHCTMDELIVE